MTWAEDCQTGTSTLAAKQTAFITASYFEHTSDALKKLNYDHSCLLLKHTIVLEGAALAVII